MNILVTGANGQLGNEMRNLAIKSGNNYIFSDITEPEGLSTLVLDITDKESVVDAVRKYEIGCIVNCAAYTNVDKAEDQEELAFKLNASAVGNLAQAASVTGALLVHVSTDYVFGGDACLPYRETDMTNPTGAYGRTKLAGEKAVQESGCRYIIIRTAWLYSPYGNNFVKTMLKLTSERDSLNVVFDQVGTPTYAADLAYAIFDIIENGKAAGNEGIYHFSNEGVCSWFDFTKVIAELSGNTACKISPCHSSEFPSKVKRPSFSVLDKTKYKSAFGLDVPYWTDSLKKCIQRIKSAE
jgi:dTDP-4-dehydrorhamnose reductase